MLGVPSHCCHWGTLWHSCVKVHEAIELLFGMMSGISPGIAFLDEGPHPARGRGGVGGFDVGLLVWHLDCLYCHSTIHWTDGPTENQKGKTREVKPIWIYWSKRDSEWQWHQLGHMQICTLTQTHNHTSIPPLSFLKAGCPFCHPTNSVKAMKVQALLLQ